MIVQKTKIHLAFMEKLGKYMPVPSYSKKFKRFEANKYAKVIKIFQILYHRTYLVCVAGIFYCHLKQLG